MKKYRVKVMGSDVPHTYEIEADGWETDENTLYFYRVEGPDRVYIQAITAPVIVTDTKYDD